MSSVAAQPGANKQFETGSLIVEQGEAASSLVLLQKGSVSLLKKDAGSDEDPDLPGHFLFTVNAPAVLGAGSLVNDSEFEYDAVAYNPGVVSIYPSNKQQLVKLLPSKPNIAVLMLRSAFKELVEAQKKHKAVLDFKEDLTRYQDSLSLALSILQPDQFQESDAHDTGEQMGFTDPVLPSAREVVAQFKDKGGSITNPLTAAFMNANHSRFLDRDFEGIPPVDSEEVNYMRRFASLNPKILGALSQHDPTLLLMTLQKINRMFQAVIDEIDMEFYQHKHMIDQLVKGDYSWLAKIALQVELFEQGMSMVSEHNLRAIAVFLIDAWSNFEDQYQAIWGFHLPDYNQQHYDRIKQFIANAPEPEEPVVNEDGTQDNSEIEEETKNSAKKIFLWAGMSTEKFQDYQRLIKQLNQLKNPLDSDSDSRKIRRGLNNLFLEVYTAAALKYFREPEPLPRLLEMFFNYGFLDETLLEKEQIVFLYNARDDGYQSKYPVHYPLDWLKQVYEKQISPSIDDLGQSYFEVLKLDNREMKWRNLSDVPDNIDTKEARLHFEMKHMFQQNIKLTSGSVMSNFSILSKYQINRNIEHSLVTKQVMDETIDKLLSIDFSAYHREVFYRNDKLGIQKEFVQVQVVPNFIIVPSCGPTMQFWQEREGKDKMSPGRLILPSLNMADLFPMLLKATGAYRWEILKTILGPDWNNISQPSLTADYTDYVQFYKKQRDLSPEAKEKLAAEFKRHRDDRARFVNDYMIYVTYESEGTQRLNKVARKILTKHIPFAKPIREELMKLPAFIDFLNKSTNIRRRKAKELEPRYKKYRTANNIEKLPEDLEETYRFWNMEY